MLEYHSNGCSIEPEIYFTDGTAISLQPIRLNCPIQGGAWAIPSLHPDIPFTIVSGDAGPGSQFLADVGLHGDALGVPLPEGEFTTLANTLKTQWSQYIQDALADHTSDTRLALCFVADDNGVKACIEATSDITTFLMRRLVDRLNKESPGLGWWVAEVANATNKDGYPIYRLPDVCDFFCKGTALTDRDFLDYLNEMECEGPRKSMREWKEHYEGLWPSQFIERVAGGHAWLLRATSDKGKPIGAKPVIATRQQALSYAGSKTSDPQLRAAVADFIALDDDLHRIESKVRLADSDGPDDIDDECDDEERFMNEPETIGASCILLWEDTETAVELIQHHEVHAMQGGEETCVHMVYALRSRNPKDVDTFIQSLKDLVRRHAAISKAFSHFDQP